MAKETKYTAHPFIFKSKGLVASYVTDRTPDGTFQNMNGCLEREENGVSTRHGSVIINRFSTATGPFPRFHFDPNFPLPFAPVTLARLRSLSGSTYRYAGLSDGSLWRRTGDDQGPYSSIATGLSGQPFTALVTTCFGSSQPFEFVYDRDLLLKDNGTGIPTQNGIFPPTMPVIATQYAPQISIIDSFQASTG